MNHVRRSRFLESLARILAMARAWQESTRACSFFYKPAKRSRSVLDARVRFSSAARIGTVGHARTFSIGRARSWLDGTVLPSRAEGAFSVGRACSFFLTGDPALSGTGMARPGTGHRGAQARAHSLVEAAALSGLRKPPRPGTRCEKRSRRPVSRGGLP
jgi:hypothetical protein